MGAASTQLRMRMLGQRGTLGAALHPPPTAAGVEPARYLGKHSPALADVPAQQHPIVPARGQAPAARCGTAPGSHRCGLTAQCCIWSTGKLFPGIPASCRSGQAGPKPCAVRHEKESRCGTGRSPRSSPHIPIAFCSSGPFAAARRRGSSPSSSSQGDALALGQQHGREGGKSLAFRRVGTQTPRDAGRTGLVGMGIKSQNTNGFCNKNLIQNR